LTNDEEFDQMFDRLSSWAQNKVLEAMGNPAQNKPLPKQKEPKQPKQNRKPRYGWIFPPLLLITFLIGFPVVAVGVILCATVVGIPLGVPIMFIGTFPFSAVMTAYCSYRVKCGIRSGTKIRAV
jgi:hypothetical protein